MTAAHRSETPLVRSLAALGLLIGSCTGAIDGGPGSSGGADLVDVRLPPRVWRLSSAHMNAEVTRLFGDGAPVVNLADGASEDHLSNIAANAGIDEASVSTLLTGSNAVATWVVENDGATRTRCDAMFGSDACADVILGWLPEAAYRRPVTAAETAELRAVFDALRAELELAPSLAGLVRAVLLSPDFLYRTELGPSAVPAGRVTMTDHEIATLLSYSVTDAAPDEELLAAAAAGTLSDPDVREAQARRLMAASGGMWQRFFWEWLHMETFDSQAVEVELDPTVAAQMEEEYAAFLDDVIVESDGTLTDVFSATHSFAGPELAEHYGASHPGTGVARIELDPTQRGGLLTLGAWLVATGKAGRDNVVRRGMNVFREAMCNEVRPPDGVDVNAELAELVPPGSSVRETSEIRGRAGACANCHRIADPAGMVFENYTSDGRWQTIYPDGNPVEASIDLAGLGAYDVAPEFTAALPEASAFRRCFLQRFAQYFVGRDLGTPSQTTWLAETTTTFRDADGRLSDLVVALVRHPAFVERQ